MGRVVYKPAYYARFVCDYFTACLANEQMRLWQRGSSTWWIQTLWWVTNDVACSSIWPAQLPSSRMVLQYSSKGTSSSTKGSNSSQWSCMHSLTNSDDSRNFCNPQHTGVDKQRHWPIREASCASDWIFRAPKGSISKLIHKKHNAWHPINNLLMILDVLEVHRSKILQNTWI